MPKVTQQARGCLIQSQKSLHEKYTTTVSPALSPFPSEEAKAEEHGDLPVSYRESRAEAELGLRAAAPTELPDRMNPVLGGSALYSDTPFPPAATLKLNPGIS